MAFSAGFAHEKSSEFSVPWFGVFGFERFFTVILLVAFVCIRNTSDCLIASATARKIVQFNPVMQQKA